jgi:hypothetical protein
VGRRSRSRWLIATIAGFAWLVPAAARCDDVVEMQRRLDAQSDLLERQSQELESLGDRLRVLEDEKSAATPATSDVAAPPDAAPAANKQHVPGSGFRIGESDWGSLNARLYTSVRYLNQSDLDDDYTNAFDQTLPVDTRQDFQVNKVTLYSFGWLMDPKLRYLLYVWSSNTSQGLGAQVVVAGNLQYRVNEYLNIGAGITSLPGTRSTSGNFPNWLGVDERMIADEFFRPSYTTGIFADGQIVPTLSYEMMLGNNLSQLGVDAGQLDSHLNTISAALTWQPLGDYGKGFGDYERHESLVTQFGVRFTRSSEDAQGQPDTEDFENVQLRLSDGSVIFAPDLFGAGTQVRQAHYQMFDFGTGIKYRGLSLEGEYYYRWLDQFQGPGTSTLPFETLRDYGFQLQGSAMLLPDELQLYLSHSKIYGQYGDPWDLRAGLNWFMFENKGIRWNNELLYVHESPVGGLSLPYLVGSKGTIFVSTIEVFF